MEGLVSSARLFIDEKNARRVETLISAYEQCEPDSQRRLLSEIVLHNFVLAEELKKRVKQSFALLSDASSKCAELKRFKKAQRLNEQRYRLALQGSSVAVWECDTDLRYTFGYNWPARVTDSAEFMGKRDDEILPFDTVHELMAMKKRVLATGAGERREISLPATNKTSHFEVVVEPIYDSDRVLTGLRGVAVDISQRKRSEEGLRSVSEELRATLYTAAVGLTHCSRDLRYLSANPAYSQWVGLPLEQIIGRPIVEVLGKAAFEIIRPHVERVLRGDMVEYEAELPIGSVRKWIQVAYTPERDASGTVVGWVASIMDITDRKRAEAALIDREQRLSLALDASAAGAWTWDASTNQCSWDDRFNAQYGFAEGVPQTFDTWFASVHQEDGPKVLAHLNDVLHRDQNEWDIEFRAVRPEGTVVWMHGLGRAGRGPDGQVTRLV